MSGTLSLLVPIKLSALCVSSKEQLAGLRFAKIAAEFQNLETQPYLGSSVVPSPFSDEPATAGIHLHWALPDALTQSDPSRTDGIRQAPNRFLVVRFAISSETPTRLEGKAWVIESDYIWPHDDSSMREADSRNAMCRTVPLVYPGHLDTMVKPTYAYQGRVRPLNGDWRDETTTGARQPFSALGYGTEAYAAAYPHCRNVFGFFDPCQHPAHAADGLESRHQHLSYLVVGWYADATLDPIHLTESQATEKAGPDGARDAALTNEALADALAADYRWSYRAQDRSHGRGSGREDHRPIGNRRPERTLFVGQLTEIEWTPDQAHSARHDEPVSVAIGTTISEALSAMLASTQGNAAEVEELLNDLQFGLLSEYTTAAGLASLPDARHLRDFAPVPAGHASAGESGRIWIVKRAGAKDDGGLAAGSPPDKLSSAAEVIGSVKLPPRLGSALRSLNHAQASFDELAVAVATRRSQLFADWTTYLANKDEGSKAYLQKEMKALEALHLEVRQSLSARDLAKQVMDKLLRESGDSVASAPAYELESLAAPRFYQPNDPVILLSGVSPSTRYGGDGRYDPDQQLICRLSDEITKWGYPLKKLSQDMRLRLEEILRPEHWTGLIGQALPRSEDLGSLCIEACLLNPRIEMHFGHPGFQQWQVTYLRGFRDDFKGVPPSAIGLMKHERPWIPLMLQWQAAFIPFVPHANSNNAPAANAEAKGMDDFALADEGPEIDYTGANPGFVAPGSARYEGTVTLTNNVQLNLTAQIERYLNSHPANPQTDTPATTQLRQTLEAVGRLPFRMMAQSMDGLHRQMLMRSTTLQMPVVDPPQVSVRARPDLKPAITKALEFAGQVKQAVGKERHASRLDDPRLLHPLRAGMLKVTRLRLIDAFGQIRDLIAADPQPGDAQPDSVILPARLKAPKAWNETAAVLPLRIAQPARLSFRYRSAGHPSGTPASPAARAMSSDAASSPIFGWILHNRFDHALGVYDEEGRPLGSFNLNGLVWQEAPGPNKGVASSHLLEFMQHLGGGWASADRSQFQGEFLAELIDTIDRAVTGVDVDGYRQDQGLAVLIGRPLALVQADLRLDLYGSVLGDSSRQAGLPVIDQSRNAFMLAMMRSNVAGAEPAGYAERTRRSSNMATVRFPVRLGDNAKLHDGLVGYFVQDADPATTYRTFYAAAAASGGGAHIVKPALSGAGRLSLAAADKAATGVIMLVDPRAPVHATTGILPVKSIALPPQQYAEALKRIDATFLVAPVLGGASGVALPVPAEVGHAWSWLTRHADEELFDAKGAGVRKWVTQDLVESPTTRAAFSAKPLRLNEGWLHLYPSTSSPDGLTGKTVAAGPTPYNVVIRPNPIGDLILAPETATLHGAGITLAEVDDGTRFIGYWRDERDWVSWKVHAHGGYGVDIRYSAPFDSQFDMEVLDPAGKMVWTEHFHAPKTGWDRSQRAQVVRGQDFPGGRDAPALICFGLDPGEFEVRIKPAHRLGRGQGRDGVDRPWSAVNIWSFALQKLVQADRAVIQLWAWAATLHGNAIRLIGAPADRPPGDTYIGRWTDPKDYVAWRVGLGAGLWQLRLSRKRLASHQRLDTAQSVDGECELAVDVRRMAHGELLASSQVVLPQGQFGLTAFDLATDAAGEYEVRVRLLRGAFNLGLVILDGNGHATIKDEALMLWSYDAVLLNAGPGHANDKGWTPLRLRANNRFLPACAWWTIDMGDRQAEKINIEVCYSTQHSDARIVIESREVNAPVALAEVALTCEATGDLSEFRTKEFMALDLMLVRPKAGRYQLRLRLEDPVNGAPVDVQSVKLLMPQ